MITHVLEQLIAKLDLTPQQMQEVIHDCMSGELSDGQIAAFLALMRMKGETENELTAAAHVMKRFAHSLELEGDLIDIVGTGGDGKNTFNVSTASSFVIAAAGVSVAKHGNRSVSSRSGSADLLEQAGLVLNLNDDHIRQCIKQCNLAFLFAPHYHPAMLHARNARQQLGIRTLFNLLGPLINPAGVKKQVVGVFSSAWLTPVAKVLANLGSERALVVHSQDGLDEISIAAATDVVELREGVLHSWTIDPQDFGMHYSSLNDILVESPQQSLQLIESVFSGEQGAARDMVVINSAAALHCAKNNLTLVDAIQMAKVAIDSGKAKECFHTLCHLTQTLTKETNP